MSGIQKEMPAKYTTWLTTVVSATKIRHGSIPRVQYSPPTIKRYTFLQPEYDLESMK